jgi:hypothetical protein
MTTATGNIVTTWRESALGLGRSTTVQGSSKMEQQQQQQQQQQDWELHSCIPDGPNHKSQITAAVPSKSSKSKAISRPIDRSIDRSIDRRSWEHLVDFPDNNTHVTHATKYSIGAPWTSVV